MMDLGGLSDGIGEDEGVGGGKCEKEQRGN